ncbi:ATP-binding protein [Xanthobacter sp. DSM 24535]|uniref:sensor histidine kinase n=1 Tax=Roseixanthobacter psychrophilus TaxID=3119917 RepID=UPI00372A14BA
MPVSAAGLALAIFIFDTFSSVGIAIAVLYVVVVLMAVSFTRTRGLVLVSLGCASLTVLAYLIEHGEYQAGPPLLRCAVSLLAILIATVLGLRNQRATRILLDSERRYRSIFQSTAVSIWEEDLSQVTRELDRLRAEGITDLRGHFERSPEALRRCLSLVRVVDVNEAAMDLVGASDRPEFMAQLAHVFLPETQASFREFILAYYEGAARFSYETVIRTIRGDRCSILMNATFPTGADPYDNVLVSIVDITDRIHAQRALEQSRAELAHVARVVTLGELTASIAHEVNQPLAAIVTNGEAAMRWLSRTPPNLEEVGECLGEMVREGRRAGDVVKRLRKLATKGEPERATLDLSAAVAEAVALVERELSEQGVALRLDLEPNRFLIVADRVQIQQVVINLVINAIHAMADLPVRTLSIRVHHETQLADAPAGTPSEGFMVTVTDTGKGIAPDAMANLFTAFFSTKPTGMGMGLSICRSIIEAHGGLIWATRNPERGVSFHFILPATPQVAA